MGDGDGADDGQSEAMVVVDAGAIESLEGLEEAVEPQSEPVPRRRRGQPPELGRDAEGRALDERIERAAGQLSGPVAQHLPAVPVDSFQSTTPFQQLLERLRMTIGRTTFHLAFRALVAG